MARRRSATSGSPQPTKRVKVAGAQEDEENANHEAEGHQDQAEKKKQASSSSDGSSRKKEPSPPPRRNVRRAAASRAAAATAAMAVEDAAAVDVPARDIIHEKVFAPITREEREQWKGWTDIESEPAFFNVILNELGVQDAKIQEVFAVDMVSLEMIPNALGFIFLYKFVEEDQSEERHDAPPQLWFANQTTANACATLAMLNIAMNCPQLTLSPDLARFQAATAALDPALRGHLLNTHAGIRAAHNTFARRMDMLTSDLALKREWAEAGRKKRKAMNAASTKKKKSNKQQKSSSSGSRHRRRLAEDDAAFHFIAYVPMGDDVWELNGMQAQPLRLGSVGGAVVENGSGPGPESGPRPRPDWTTMARDRIEARMQAYAEFEDMAMFNLLALCHTPKEDEPTTTESPKASGAAAHTLEEEDALRAEARQRDYTPVVHAWIKKLADKGVLRQLATGDGRGAEEGEEGEGGEGVGAAAAAASEVTVEG